MDGRARANTAGIEPDDVERLAQRRRELRAGGLRVVDARGTGTTGVDDQRAEPVSRSLEPDHRDLDVALCGLAVVEWDGEPRALEGAGARGPGELLAVVLGEVGRRRGGWAGGQRGPSRGACGAGGNRCQTPARRGTCRGSNRDECEHGEEDLPAPLGGLGHGRSPRVRAAMPHQAEAPMGVAHGLNPA